MAVESIGIMLLFPCSDFHNSRLATSESCEHTFGNYRKFERDFTVECMLKIEYMNRWSNRAMYESDLRMH